MLQIKFYKISWASDEISSSVNFGYLQIEIAKKKHWNFQKMTTSVEHLCKGFPAEFPMYLNYTRLEKENL